MSDRSDYRVKTRQSTVTHGQQAPPPLWGAGTLMNAGNMARHLLTPGM
ncbi:TPA: hypothetical protein ACYSEN_005275 [Klebsiella pneumoniae]